MRKDALIFFGAEQHAKVKKVSYNHIYAFIAVVLCAVDIINPQDIHVKAGGLISLNPGVDKGRIIFVFQ